MPTSVIIALCSLLLLAYLFDVSSARTKIPAVVLLLALGWIVRQITEVLAIQIPDLSALLPIFGTIGLILIVLEGSLEVELKRSKKTLIQKSFWVALLPVLVLSFGLAFLFQYLSGAPLKHCLTNAIPICVISSAIAIPSAKNLDPFNREFVTYESSLSDILGIMFFNFIALNENFGLPTFGRFGLQLLLIVVISFVATVALAWLLNRIQHHVKYVPIILLVILLYSASKIYHLPGLVFIMMFGLFLGNLDELKNLKWIEKLRPDELDTQVHKFGELLGEISFLIRSLFFMLFGYLIETTEILNTETIALAGGIVTSIVLLRVATLYLFKIPAKPLALIAPRGLITILLFLSIAPEHTIYWVNKSLILQVIILTALVMMSGMMGVKKEPSNPEL